MHHMPIFGNTLPSSDFLKLLGHDLRWQILGALAHSDRRVHELVELVGRPMNLVSYHLRLLREAHLVCERRSSADGRDVYYRADLDTLVAQYRLAGTRLHPALDPQPVSVPAAAATPARVLFLCTYNSARSQMAEGLLRHLARAWVEVVSAGSEPSTVHPLALRTMDELGIDIHGQRSKHLDEYRGQQFDYVITVCDQVREICPAFPHQPEQVHWSIADPSDVPGNDQVRLRAFQEAARELSTRIRFLSLLNRWGTPSA